VKRLRWVLPLVLLLAAAAWWTLGGATEDEADWGAVERGDLVIGVEVTGTLRAVETEILGPPQLRDTWQFKISHLAPEGEEVEQGAVVVAFDASELEQRLQRELAERDAAQKRVEKAEKELAVSLAADELRLAEAQARQRKAALKVERPPELAAARELGEYRLDRELAETEVRYLEQRLGSARRSAQARLEALRNQLVEAERQVGQTERDIEQMEVRAPRAGTVIYTSDWREEKKKIGDSTWRGESVVEMPSLERMKGLGEVHEADAGRLVEGQRVALRLDAHPEVEFTGRVASIWRTVQRESRRNPLKVVRIDIELDTTDTRRMRPGMRFRGTLETERVAHALLVDLDTVFLEDQGPVCYRRAWRGPEPVAVKLGRRSKTRVEVLEGLAEGDRVSRVAPRSRREAVGAGT
jgi:multidrug efflux pump subunit AcrA (membrane-fusion protein)